MDEQYLAHYGVIGMKWGIRKDPREAYRKATVSAEKQRNKIAKYEQQVEKRSGWVFGGGGYTRQSLHNLSKSKKKYEHYTRKAESALQKIKESEDQNDEQYYAGVKMNVKQNVDGSYDVSVPNVLKETKYGHLFKDTLCSISAKNEKQLDSAKHQAYVYANTIIGSTFVQSVIEDAVWNETYKTVANMKGSDASMVYSAVGDALTNMSDTVFFGESFNKRLKNT